MPKAPLATSPWMSFAIPTFAPLKADAVVDVCVVGAGVAGLSTAYLLARKGKGVMVLDDGPIGGGMTSRTTAHLTNAIDDRYHEIERMHGPDGASLAAESHSVAIEAIEAIVSQEAMDCDFARLDGYLFNAPEGDPEELLREYGAALRAGVEGVEWVDSAPLADFDTGRCLRFPRQGQLHPLKYLAGLARAIVRMGGVIHCGTHVAEFHDGKGVKTSSGYTVACQDIVVATNAPVNDRVTMVGKQAPYMTYVVALRMPRGTAPNALLWDTRDPYHYVRLDRTDGDLLIVGGEDHRSGQADDPERRYANLELWARTRFPSARELVHRWSGQVMESHDGLGFAGRNPDDQNTYIITGDSGMGMTHATLGAIVITDLIHGVAVRWAELYDPSRVSLAAARTLAKENSNVAWQYASWIRAGEVDSFAEIPRGGGAVVRQGLRKVAAYRNEDGVLLTLSAACPHLGCPVSWNPAERTWDCKCHGSRFDREGTVISGPANRSLDTVEISTVPGTVDARRARDDLSPPAS